LRGVEIIVEATAGKDHVGVSRAIKPELIDDLPGFRHLSIE